VPGELATAIKTIKFRHVTEIVLAGKRAGAGILLRSIMGPDTVNNAVMVWGMPPMAFLADECWPRDDRPVLAKVMRDSGELWRVLVGPGFAQIASRITRQPTGVGRTRVSLITTRKESPRRH
jgi:hypothetical protein